MRQGHLSQYFRGVAAKRLSAVEIDAVRSHQHEINGDGGLRRLLGEVTERVHFTGRFVYVNDNDAEPVVDDGFFTWYDARQRARLERGVERTEYRLYFPDTAVTNRGRVADLLILARMQDDTLLAVVAEGNSTAERQMRWLFGLADLADGFTVRSEEEGDRVRLEFAARFILRQIGVETEDDRGAEGFVEELLHRFGAGFPPTRDFSSFARATVGNVVAGAEPDETLLAWMDREEMLFRALERHLIAQRLRQGFEEDVDGFISFSLSVQNRRKSRVGAALENHLEEIFRAGRVRYARAAVTENRSRPDFLFPGAAEYRDSGFEAARLSMLGVKSTCKDRWRQVLTEAYRIPDKHLLTLEPGISEFQTDEMRSCRLRLVLPKSLHQTFTPRQQRWLMSLGEFVALMVRKGRSDFALGR